MCEAWTVFCFVLFFVFYFLFYSLYFKAIISFCAQFHFLVSIKNFPSRLSDSRPH